MPVLPSNQKQAFINIVAAAPYPGGPAEAVRLQTILNNYSDIPTAIYRQLPLFASNNAYLSSVMDAVAISNANLLGAGIWYKQTSASPPITDPVMVINSNITEIILNAPSPPGTKTLSILGSSNIGEIALVPGCELNNLYIGPGATVDKLTASLTLTSPPTTSRVDLVQVDFLKSTPAALNMATFGSNIGSVIVTPGSYYGGVLAYDPANPCSAVVTGLMVTDITYNSALLSWTLPISSPPGSQPFLFINIFWRLTNSSVWIPVSASDGDYAGQHGFVFRNLDKDTLYDFRVETVCPNGGLAEALIGAQTVCCNVYSPPI